MKLLLEHDRAALFHGDSARLGDVLGPETIDAVVCDPPAGVSFMGKGWDDDKGGRDQWIAWLRDLLAPTVRAMKPGAHLLAWALPRTSHWTTTALEDAGLEIRDSVHDVVPASALEQAFLESLSEEQILALSRALECGDMPSIWYHVFGSGFPKSLNISKQLDEADASRAIGFGTALKPAVEHWILARKPIVGTYAKTWLVHGTGALNVDACRIGSEPRVNPPAGNKADPGGSLQMSVTGMPEGAAATSAVGRWPAHLILEHASDCVQTGEDADARVTRTGERLGDDSRGLEFGMGKQATTTTTTIERWSCAPGCPAKIVDEQSGLVGARADVPADAPSNASSGHVTGLRRRVGSVARKDAGGASRFFYCPKPAKSETEQGLDHLPKRTGGEITDREEESAGVQNPRAGAGRGGGRANVHPTKKGQALMRWLCRLVCPPGGIILDPFAGSGSTGVAALAEGFSFVGCELGGDDDEYVPILVGRVRHALGLEPDLSVPGSPGLAPDGRTVAEAIDAGITALSRAS